MGNDFSSLRECRLGGHIVPVRRISGSRARDFATWAYPGRDGEEREDMGAASRRWTLDAVFFGENYRSDFQAIVDLQEAARPVRFDHPHFGSFTVRIGALPDEVGMEAAHQITTSIELLEELGAELGLIQQDGGIPAALTRTDTALADGASALTDVLDGAAAGVA